MLKEIILDRCCAQHPGIGHVIDGSTAYLLPRKPEGQPHTYNTDRLTLCLTYRLTYVSNASRMCIKTEPRPIRNINESSAMSSRLVHAHHARLVPVPVI